MAATIKTTGELREFMVNMMVGVKNGQVDDSKARNLTKMCAQINESFYSEIKTQKLRHEAGERLRELGEMPINK